MSYTIVCYNVIS
jgi:hypothetical protein